MNIIFSAINASANENYIADKLNACRQKPSSTELEEIGQNVGKANLPLVAEADLPAFTQAQSNVIEINKAEILKNLDYIVPLLPDEMVENTSFSLLTEDSAGFAANTPVLTVTSNFSTLNYLFNGYRVENGFLKEAASSIQNNAAAPSLVPADAALDNAMSVSNFIETLAEALLGAGLGSVFTEIANMVAGSFFNCLEVATLEKYVQQAIEQNDINNCTVKLNAVIEWFGNSYKEENTNWNSLNTQLQRLTEGVMPVLARYHAAFPVYAAAGDIALLLCQQMDSLPDKLNNSGYQPQTPIYAPQFINVLTQLIRGSFEKRAGWIKVIGASNPTGNYAYYYDYLTNYTGPEAKLPACDSNEPAVLQVEYGKLQYIWNTLYPEFQQSNAASIKSVNAWCKMVNQTQPRFSYGDTLMGITNEYIPAGGGLISSNGQYCLLFADDSQFGTHFTTSYFLIIFSTADGKTLWQSPTGGGWRAYMQQDRNFILYTDKPKWASGNNVIWDLYPVGSGDPYLLPAPASDFSSKTGEGNAGPYDYVVIMQTDGNLVMYPNREFVGPKAVWATHSNPT